MERPLGMDFSWIFLDFGGQDGPKLGGKINKKSIQKGIKKHMPKSSRLGRLLDASGPLLGRLLRALGSTDALGNARRYLGGPPPRAFL